MDSSGIYHTLASILASVSSSSVAQELENASLENQANLAQVLAEILRRENYGDADATKVLDSYIRRLIYDAVRDDSTMPGANFQLAVRLAHAKFLDNFVEETVGKMEELLRLGIQSHASSDDAFEVDMREFLEAHAKGVFNDTVQYSIEGQNIAELHDIVLRQLRFWNSHLLVNKTNVPSHTTKVASLLPARLLAAMGLRNQKIATASSDVLNHILNYHHASLSEYSEVFWEGICSILNSSVRVDLALKLWLGWVSAKSPIVQPTQEMLQQDKYWSLIQASLATGFSERRKYSLYILMSSLSLLRVSVNTRTLQFEPKTGEKSILTWNKYSTLIEITSLSTSPNQLRDAMPDIRRLLDASSPIPTSWMVVLIALGFSSGSGGVQKAVWEMILDLEKRQLARLFGEIEGRRFLKDIILPYGSIAGTFAIKPSQPDFCEHGTAFAKFLSTVLKVNVSTTKETALMILGFIDERQDFLFAPARLYILKGVMDGLTKQLVFDESDHMKILVKIAKVHRFTKMKTDACVAAVMRLFLNIDVAKVGLDNFLSSLTEAISIKDYLLSREYIANLGNHLKTCLAGQPMDFGDILYNLVESYKKYPPSRNDLLKAVLIFYLTLFFQEFQSPVLDVQHLIDQMQCQKEYGLRFTSIMTTNQSLFKIVQKKSRSEHTFLVVLNQYVEETEGPAYIKELAALLSGISPETFKNDLGESSECPESVLKAIEVSWSHVLSSRASTQKFELEFEQQRTDNAVIFAQCSRFATFLGAKVPTLHLGQTIETLRTYFLPILGRNKHDNIEMTATAERFLQASLQILDQCLQTCPVNQLDFFTVSEILDILPRLMRFLENQSLLRALECIRTMASRVPSELQKYIDLDSLILQLYETVDATTLRSEFISTYFGFIDIIFHPPILELARSHTGMTKTINKIALEILKMGTSKRSIKPKFSLSLWNAFIESPEVVCSSPWLVDIVVDIINTSMNVKDMDFIVDYPLAEVFNEIAPGSRDHYREYNGETEIYAQVYMFDMLSRMDESNNIQANFVKLIREKLFKPWTQNFPGMPIYVAWKKPSYLQTLVLLERFVLESEAPGFLDLIITKVLSYEPHPRYRFLLEWIMVLCILRFPENRDCIWKHLRFPENQNPKLMASLLRVGLMVARELDTSIREEFFTELVHVDVPLASSTKAIIRHQAIAMLLELWDDAVTFGFESLTSNSFFSRVYQGVIHSPYYKEYSGAKSFRTFDAKKNYSLSGIFGGGYLIGGDPVELIQAHYFTELPETPQRLISIGASSLIEIEQSQNSKVSFSRQDAEALTEALTAPLQTKAQSWDPSTLLNPPKKPSSVTSIPEPTSSDLILMASLIENPLNLGGISRVSECLGVRELVVGSKALTKTSEFSSTSVHSEAWLSITEVPVAEITAYLREKRSQGYTVVGVEQTDRSEILGHGWACPKRCVLVLGTEKFGIPADLLVELDSCVEIPQTGVTRSMNVQTAAGVVLYECFRQGNAEK